MSKGAPTMLAGGGGIGLNLDGSTNPFAFPSEGNSNWGMAPQHGMTLRDWFAGQAFGATIGTATGLGEFSKEDRAALFDQVAEIIYEAADAMLRARLPAAALAAIDEGEG